MYRVDKIAWSGLYFPIESFETFRDAKKFCENHKDFSLAIFDVFTEKKLYERILND